MSILFTTSISLTDNLYPDAKKNKFQKEKTQIINSKVIMC